MEISSKALICKQFADYSSVSYSGLLCLFTPFVLYKKESAGISSANMILKDYQNGEISYDDLMGSFRVIIVDENKDSVLFFTDNEGIQCFFIDTHNNTFSDRFLRLIHNKRIKPNYSAIMQFLKFACIYGDETPCENIIRTQADMVYTIDKGGLTSQKKDLLPIGTNHCSKSLHDLLQIFDNEFKGTKYATVVTGGTDSRMLLANLYSINQNQHLAISGSNEHPDVIKAKEIAKILGLELMQSDESHTFDHNIDQIMDYAFLASDGIAPMLGSFRIHVMQDMLLSLGYEIYITGVGGEIYKNSFINQDFPFYFGSADYDNMYKNKIEFFSYPRRLLGEQMIEHEKNMKNTLYDILNTHAESGFGCSPASDFSTVAKTSNGKKFDIYNSVGYYLLKCRAVTFSNSANICIVAPLLERDSVSLVHGKNPYSLEMQMFQRKQITKRCPQIARVKSTSGMTCSSRRLDIVKDVLGGAPTYMSVIIGRVLRKKNILRSVEQIYQIVFKSDRFVRATTCCKKLGIIPDTFSMEDAPVNILDRLITIGLIFDEGC